LATVLAIVFPQQLIGQRFYARLKEYCSELPKEFKKIPGDRKMILEQMGDYLYKTTSKGKTAQLLFVCTQNSRRSQFAQVWAQTAAYYYKLKNIKTYSGGYSETAINYRILEALRKAGFSVTAAENYSQNPVYLLSLGQRYPDIFIFSKRYDFWQNPNEKFTTVLCSKDLIDLKLEPGGTEKVFPLPYEDIQIYDNSTGNILKNDKICRQVATEMFYMMNYVSKAKKLKKKHSSDK
jgi:hypothetical protein